MARTRRHSLSASPTPVRPGSWLPGVFSPHPRMICKLHPLVSPFLLRNGRFDFNGAKISPYHLWCLPLLRCRSLCPSEVLKVICTTPISSHLAPYRWTPAPSRLVKQGPRMGLHPAARWGAPAALRPPALVVPCGLAQLFFLFQALSSSLTGLVPKLFSQIPPAQPAGSSAVGRSCCCASENSRIGLAGSEVVLEPR